MKKTTSLLLGLMLVCAACSKQGMMAPTKENLAGTYHLLKCEKVTNGNSLDLTLDCQRDDVYKFNLDSSHQVFDGSTKCSPSSDVSGAQWWVEQEAYFVFRSGSEKKSYRIMTFDGDDLVLTLFAGQELQTFYFLKQR